MSDITATPITGKQPQIKSETEFLSTSESESDNESDSEPVSKRARGKAPRSTGPSAKGKKPYSGPFAVKGPRVKCNSSPRPSTETQKLIEQAVAIARPADKVESRHPVAIARSVDTVESNDPVLKAEPLNTADAPNPSLKAEPSNRANYVDSSDDEDAAIAAAAPVGRKRRHPKARGGSKESRVLKTPVRSPQTAEQLETWKQLMLSTAAAMAQWDVIHATQVNFLIQNIRMGGCGQEVMTECGRLLVSNCRKEDLANRVTMLKSLPSKAKSFGRVRRSLLPTTRKIQVAHGNTMSYVTLDKSQKSILSGSKAALAEVAAHMKTNSKP